MVSVSIHPFPENPHELLTMLSVAPSQGSPPQKLQQVAVAVSSSEGISAGHWAVPGGPGAWRMHIPGTKLRCKTKWLS